MPLSRTSPRPTMIWSTLQSMVWNCHGELCSGREGNGVAVPGKCTNLTSHWGSEGWSAPKVSPDPHLPGCLQGDASQLCSAIHSLPCQPRTPGDHPLQVDDVGVVELCHDAGLTQEVPPLLLCVACLQCFDGHGNLPLPWQLQAAVAHLSRLPCKARESASMESSSASCAHPPTP